MKTWLLSMLDALRANYWFIPAVMSIAAIAMSFMLTTIDAEVGSTWLENIPWVYANKPEGARVVLSTIAGSMITVAGVVFSITIAAVSYASAQYGPRLLSNFLRDRANQFTLGTFVATFLYCLLVIRTVRNAENAPGLGENSAFAAGAFVPNIAIVVGIFLALCSIAVLIFFVHHVAKSIHISHVISEIGVELKGKIEHRFPKMIGEGPESSLTKTERDFDLPPPFRSNEAGAISPDELKATRDILVPLEGYVQAIDDQSLLDLACKNGLVVRLLVRPGDFRRQTSIAMQAWPPMKVTDELASSLQRCLIIGNLRTPVQDLMFLVDELNEIAARALSPGVNDPFTAMNCINWLGIAVDEIGRRQVPSPYRYDNENHIRLIAETDTFSDFASAAFGQMRTYAANDINCAIYLAGTMADIATMFDDRSNIETLKNQVSLLLEACQHRLSDPDLAIFKERAARALDLMSAAPQTRQLRHVREIFATP